MGHPELGASALQFPGKPGWEGHFQARIHARDELLPSAGILYPEEAYSHDVGAQG